MERLGASERTVNRMAERGQLQQGYLNLPGRRPAPVFNPADVETIQAEQEAAKTFPVPAQTALVRQNHASPNGAEMMAAMLSVAQASAQRAPEISASYVGIEDAVRISGLPRGFLLEQVKAGAIKAHKIGRWYLRRQDLEAM